MEKEKKQVQCQVCKRRFSPSKAIHGSLVRLPIVEEIRKAHPNWSTSEYICLDDLNHFRGEYVQRLLEAERGELSGLEHTVVRSLREHEMLATNTNKEFEQRLTFGERLSDRIAAFGGSWKFIILFTVLLFLWMLLNAKFLTADPFDPFPFILLNLVLSTLAAIQAPVIMMSQNRQEAKDRLRSEHDYRINLKAELEIRLLSEKVDHLLRHQWERLAEIQQIQMDVMDDQNRSK
ncbi:MAG: DUF1003 domain-containing protein [Candidatus Omnitrophica bacterium]|nr:DUF1003 domain-containing protein [Candidatus Omnitrophota bacterium]